MHTGFKERKGQKELRHNIHSKRGIYLVEEEDQLTVTIVTSLDIMHETVRIPAQNAPIVGSWIMQRGG